eukprot:scaffold47678_cov19-Prasinocladus_malaysianus.AAC.1
MAVRLAVCSRSFGLRVVVIQEGQLSIQCLTQSNSKIQRLDSPLLDFCTTISAFSRLNQLPETPRSDEGPSMGACPPS